MDNQEQNPQQTPPATDPVGQTPSQIEQSQVTPQHAEVAPEVTQPTEPQPEVLFKDFLDGKAVAYHKPIDLQIAPLQVKQIEGGGIIITPSSQLLVKYKDQ